MNLTVLIADELEEDRFQLINNLRAAAEKRQDLQLQILEYASGEQLLTQYAPGTAQMAFLDVCMDGIDGIEAARALRESDSKLLIVFYTASREYAFDAFPIHIFDYLIKPCSSERISRTLEDALRNLSMNEDVVRIKAARCIYQVPLSQIVSIHSFGHYLDVHLTGEKRIRSIMTFAKIRSLLSEDARFLECHRGILINMDHVLTLKEDMFLMDEGPSCALRIRDRSKLVSQFSQYKITRSPFCAFQLDV